MTGKTLIPTTKQYLLSACKGEKEHLNRITCEYLIRAIEDRDNVRCYFVQHWTSTMFIVKFISKEGGKLTDGHIRPIYTRGTDHTNEPRQLSVSIEHFDTEGNTLGNYIQEQDLT